MTYRFKPNEHSKSPSATKKGPGRYHKQGYVKPVNKPKHEGSGV